MTTRIPAVSPQQAGPFVKLAYRIMRRRFDEVPEPFAVLANHPKLFTASVIHESATERASKVLPAEFVFLKIQQLAGQIQT